MLIENNVPLTKSMAVTHQLMEHADRTIDSLVIDYKRFRKGTALSTILRFETLALAKRKGALVEFCEKIDCKIGSSTTRKYLKIGLEADWLLAIADYLPAEWTTIYKLAQLGQARVNILIDLGILHPNMTAKELRAATSSALPSTTASTSVATKACLLQVDASILSDHDKLALFNAIEAEAVQHGLHVTGLPGHLRERIIIEQGAV